MTLIIQMFMLACGAFIVIFCKTRASSIGKTPVFSAGCVAITAVFGVAWMADTMFAAHLADLKAVMTEIVRQYPWAYALVLILTSKLVNSQAAAVATIVPVALSIGVPRASWFPAPPPATATTSCRPTRPTWPLSSSTAPARRTSAASCSTTPSFFRV